MRIGINARSFLNPQYTGIGRYAYNLVDSLGTIDQSNDYYLYVAKKLFNFKKKVPQFKYPNVHVNVDRFNTGLEKTLKNIDLYHSPSPDVFQIQKCKIVVTVHDFVYKAYPEGHTENTLRLTEEQMQSFLPVVDRIICISKNTQKDLINFFSVDKSKTTVIEQGVDKSVFYSINEQEMDFALNFRNSKSIGEKFLLFVGTIEPRKNLKGLLKAFAKLKKSGSYSGQLVVVGMVGWKTEGLTEFIDSLGIRNDIVFLDFVNNDELRYCYNLCDCFVFPSFYEGFGYPILEAFCCGAPVVASSRASCPEVAGDAALIVDPNDIEQMACAINRVLEDKKLKDDLINKGHSQSNHFGFQKTAEKTLKVYQEVLSS